VLQSAQLRAVVNTVLSLLGSVLSTFAASAFVDNRFNIMHVQVGSRLPGSA
jgi:ammonium transporter Rh